MACPERPDQVHAQSNDGYQTRAGSFRAGRDWFMLPTLTPGVYTLDLWSDDVPRRSFPVTIRAGEDFILVDR